MRRVLVPKSIFKIWLFRDKLYARAYLLASKVTFSSAVVVFNIYCINKFIVIFLVNFQVKIRGESPPTSFFALAKTSLTAPNSLTSAD